MPWMALMLLVQIKYCNQLFLQTSRQMPNWQVLILHFQVLLPINEAQLAILILCIQIFDNWIKLTILYEMVTQQFDGLFNNLVNALIIMEIAWVAVQEEINRAMGVLYGTGSTASINFLDNILNDIDSKLLKKWENSFFNKRFVYFKKIKTLTFFYLHFTYLFIKI